MAKREAGWSAVGREELASQMFEIWKNTNGPRMTIAQLTMARDYAVLTQVPEVVERVNSDLRIATCWLLSR